MDTRADVDHEIFGGPVLQGYAIVDGFDTKSEIEAEHVVPLNDACFGAVGVGVAHPAIPPAAVVAVSVGVCLVDPAEVVVEDHLSLDLLASFVCCAFRPLEFRVDFWVHLAGFLGCHQR